MVRVQLLNPHRALHWEGYGLRGVQEAVEPLGLSALEQEGQLVIYGQPGGEVYRLNPGEWFVLGDGRAEVMSDHLFRGKFSPEGI